MRARIATRDVRSGETLRPEPLWAGVVGLAGFQRPGVREAAGPFLAAYTERVLERATPRALPMLNRAAEIAPATQACCGACRTCVTTNIFGVLAFAATALVSPLARFARRIA